MKIEVEIRSKVWVGYD